MKVLKIRNTHYGDEYYWEHTRHTIYATDGKNHETVELQDGQEFDSTKLAFKPTMVIVEAITRIITPDDSSDQKPRTTVYHMQEFLANSPEAREIAEALKNFGSNAEFMQEFLAHCPSCETLLEVFQKYRGTLACFDDLKALVLAKANAEEIYLFMRDVKGFATEDMVAAFFAANPDIETLRVAARGVFDSLEISLSLRKAFFAANPSEEQRKLFEFENSYRD